MADLIVLPSLERLPAHDRNGKAMFGLTFSVTTESVERLADLQPWTDLAKAFLQPWTWRDDAAPGPDAFLDLKGIRFFDSATQAAIGTMGAVRDTSKGRLTALETDLDARFTAFAAQEPIGNPWSSMPRASRELRPWSPFVAEVSLYPWPLPQSLGLSFFVELAVPAGTNDLVAAPILRARIGTWSGELVPGFAAAGGTTTKLASEAVQLTYAWPADAPDAASVSGAGNGVERPALHAQTLACGVTLPQAAATSYFDFGSLWLDTSKVALSDVDLREKLEPRLAEQLHLAPVIVDWMRNQTPPTTALARGYPRVALTVLEQLRQVTAPGIWHWPGGALLQRARSFWNAGEGAKVYSLKAVEAVHAKAKAWFDDDSTAQWAARLRQIVAGAAAAGPGGPTLLDAAVDGETALARLTLEQTLAALDQVIGAVAEPATARALFRLQWQEIVKAQYQPADAGEEAELARRLASDLPAEVDLWRLLLLDHLGKDWDARLKDAFKQPDAKAALAGAVVAILGELQWPGASSQDLAGLAGKMADRVLDTETHREAEPKATRGLTIQVDSISPDFDAHDDLHRMQGIAVLMRRKTSQNGEPWRCLNLAAAQVGAQTFDVLLPSRLAFLGGLRTATLTYDNEPLTVRGPLSDSAAAGAEVATADAREVSGFKKVLNEPLVKISYDKAALLPALIFGESYEVKPFIVSNSGALPLQLAGAVPGELRLSTLGSRSLANPLAHSYLRSVPVGALRFGLGRGEHLPAIPDGVAPRVRELPAEAVLPAKDPLRRPSGDPHATDTMLTGTALLLLAGSDLRARTTLPTSFDFTLGSPTLDLKTWDRWVARNAEKDRRRFVWRSFYELAHRQGGVVAPEGLEQAGIFLDDPAVTGIWAELQPLGLGANAAAKGQFFPLLPSATKPPGSFAHWRTDPPSLASEQHKTLPIGCKAGSKGGLTVTVDGRSLPPVAAAGIYRLSFYAVIEAPAAALEPWVADETVRTEGGHACTSPWHLLIEVVQELPRSAELSKRLLSALTTDPRAAGRGQLRADVALAGEELKGLVPFLHRAELWHQAWSWRGRPAAPVPVRGASAEQVLAFEMSELADRADSERRVLPMTRRMPVSGAPLNFVYEQPAAESGDADPRALYHRVSARFFSRYEGLLPEEEAYIDAAADDSRWHGQLVPCRPPAVVPPPKVKLVLPLTRSRSLESADTPGLLVVVDGAWHEVGGLAEELGIEVVTATAPDAGGVGQDYYEAGTDPIVTAAGAADELGLGKGALASGVVAIEFPDVVGAIGHARDNSAIGARYLASSFLVASPIVRNKNSGATVPHDFAWWFFELRFRRVLRGVQGSVSSQASAPFWVQLLPAIERLETDWFVGGAGSVRWQGNALVVSPLSSDHPPPRSGRDVPPGTLAARGDSFHLFGVMTRRVVDFGGRPDQEVYVGVWWSRGDTWTSDVIPGSDARDGLLWRWIEVQSAGEVTVAKGDDLWKRLFDPSPGADPDKERARIVRISEPFDVGTAGGTQ